MYFNRKIIEDFVAKAKTTPANQFERMIEECGELAKARAEEGWEEELAELADLLVTVFTYAESADLLEYLEEAFETKMQKNIQKNRFTSGGKIKE